MSMALDTECAHVLSDQSCASSDAARIVDTLLSDISSDFRKSISLGSHKDQADEELAAVFEEAGEPGWDGYGGEKASFESFLRARRFIEALPSDLPVPDVAVEPDGQIAFEWYAGPRRAISISVGENDELVYAGCKGASKFHGTESFNWSIPKMVTDLLRRVLVS